MSNAVNDNDQAMPALYAFADALPNAALILDRKGIICVANTRVSQTLGLSDDCALDGKSYWQVLPAGVRELVAAMQREVLIYASDARRDLEFGTPPQEPRLLELHLAPIHSNGGPPAHFCLVINDASARQQVAELKRLDTLKSNFLALISHELRTPLTSIRGAVHLLSETEPNKTESTGALVDIIHSNSERLIRLVNNLLEMVTIENETFTVTRTTANIEQLIQQSLERHAATAASKFATLTTECCPAVAPVDPERFSQLLNYLLDNALKFTPPGGRISITAKQLPEGALQLQVSDTGCGIPAYARERIFDKFYQVEEAMTRCCGGTGVGLFLARHIVEKHGGRIWADANAEGGTDFIAVFPVREEEKENEPAARR